MTSQPSLFDYQPATHQHAADPSTSREAAGHARHFAHTHAEDILADIRTHGVTSASRVAERLHMEIYQVRRRITDLKAARLIEETGTKHLLDSGRHELEYRATSHR